MPVMRTFSSTNQRWKKGDTALAYLRVSDVGDRGDSLLSPDVQLDQIKRWAEREGVKIVDVVTDLDKTGREATKRQIGKSIDRVRKGEVNGIAVWKVNRWGRNLVDSLLSVGDLMEAGGWIGSATENLNEIDSPMGRFSLTQMLAIAQLQSDQIGETWRNIHEYRQTLGLPHSGGHRFGYIWDPNEKEPSKVFVANETTGPWLRKAYLDFASGRSAVSIVKEMQAASIKTVRDNYFTPRGLVQTLDTGFGAGLFVTRKPKGQWNPNEWTFQVGAHDGVISLDEWAAYLRRRATKRPPREMAPVHRLAGLMRCGTCLRKMRYVRRTLPSGTNGSQYACQAMTSYQSTVPCEAKSNISQTVIEREVLEWLKRNHKGADAHGTHVAREQRAVQAKADAEAVDADVQRYKRMLNRITDLIVQEEDEDQINTYKERQKEYREHLKDLVLQRDALMVEADVTSIPAISAFGAMIQAWEGTPPGSVEMLNEALRAVIHRIEIHPGDKANRVRIVPLWDDAARDAMPGMGPVPKALAAV